MMKYNEKEIMSISYYKPLLLERTKLINSQDPFVFQDLLREYKGLDTTSSAALRAVCTLTNAILTHERLYFAMTRDDIKNMMKLDSNIPKNLRKGFNNGQWSIILMKLYNDFGVIKLLHQGNTKRASAFEVIHPDIVQYLEPKVNREKQLEETLAFCQKKSQ